MDLNITINNHNKVLLFTLTKSGSGKTPFMIVINLHYPYLFIFRENLLFELFKKEINSS